MDKIFIGADELLRDSFLLAEQIYQSGFRPDFIVGVWRGGAPVGIAVQEYFEFAGVSTDHIAIRTSSYVGIGQASSVVRVHGLHYLVENIRAGHQLLIVDDVFDSGRSVEAIFRELQQKSGDNMPGVVRVACPWYKPEKNVTAIVPDFFVLETNKWLVFPHELAGLTADEIRSGKPFVASALESILRSAPQGKE